MIVNMESSPGPKSRASRRRLFSIQSLLLCALLIPLAPFGGSPVHAAVPTGCWRIVPTPQLEIQLTGLLDLTSSPNGEVWALGAQSTTGQYRSTLLRWDGNGWNAIPGPTYTQSVTRTYSLTALKVFSSNDIWAAGGVLDNADQIVSAYWSALVTHWDGQTWTTVLSSPAGGPFAAIDGVSANDIWAVGWVVQGQVGGQPILKHWNGSSWTDYSHFEYNHVNDVVALSSDNVWAIGDQAWHWDGETLTNRNAGASQLESIVAVGPDDIWAVGRGLAAVHWDGKTWQRTIVPKPGKQADLLSVAAPASNNVWAVGAYDDQALITHWDGMIWTNMPNPIPGFSSRLDKIVAANGELWATGTRVLSPPSTGINTEPVILHYTGDPCPATTPQQPLNPPAPLPGTGSQEFITGQRSSGIFLNYWLNHGGVLQQGYPISPVIGEQSDLNNQIYTVQYYERAVFEYHPEETDPQYKVLLSQLGTFQYRQKYPNGAPNQRANQDRGTLSFSQTGKKLGGSFLKYWQDHGGLAQNGYPLSDEFTEVSDLDGKPYTVQYFERSVFEWHPENAPPYNVLLSQLGRYRWDDKYGTGTSPSATPRKLTGSAAGGRLVGAGHYLTWLQPQSDSTGSIFAYDAVQNRQAAISSPIGDGMSLATNGSYVFWNRRDTGQLYLEGYDLKKSAPTKIDPPPQMDFRRVTSFGLDSSWLYYPRSNFTSTVGLYAHNLATNEERKLAPPAPGMGGIVAAEGYVLWTEERSVGVSAERTLHLTRLDGQDIVIAEGIGGFTGYEMSGDNVVYSFFSDISNQTTYLLNIKTGARKVISLGRTSGPVITGERVAWVRWPDPAQGESNGWSIEAYSIQNGSTTTAIAGLPAMPHNLVLLDGGALAYIADIDMTTPGYDLFIVDLGQ